MSKNHRKETMKRTGPEITVLSDPITPEEKIKYDKRRWTAHSVEKLPQGVSLVDDGRSAYLYLREGDRLFELYMELAGSSSLDVVGYSSGLKTSISIASRSRSPIPQSEYEWVRSEMEAWLKARKTKYTID